jgi:tetratricopeptide (TPR) repeat protein
VPAPRREAAARLILLLPALLLVGCGILGRQRDCYIGLQHALQEQDPEARQEALATLRGAEPLINAVWLASASVASTPEESLAYVNRGLQFLPQDPDLLVSRMSLLAQMGRRDDELAAARAALDTDAPTQLRAEALWFLVDGLLAGQRVKEAEPEVIRMRGLPFSQPDIASTAWARIALAWELAAQPDDADRTMDASLDLGATGLSGLRRASLASPDRQVAASRIVQRASERQPDQPDLKLYLLVDQMTAGDLDGAMAALEALPGPLPERLVSQREAIRARILMLQGRTEDGLAVLRARLEEEPGDAFALGVLLESFHVRHVPEPAEMVYWLKSARRHVYDPALAQELEATLAAIAKASEQAPAPTPPP